MNKLKHVYSKLKVNSNEYLYRYLTLDKALDFIIRKRLFFSRLDLLNDKYEGIDYQHLSYLKKNRDIDHSYGGTSGLDDIDFRSLWESKREFIKKLEGYQKRHFALCWNVGKRESFSMWSTYSNSGVALCVRPDKLINCLSKEGLDFHPPEFDSIYYGRVVYKDFTLNNESEKIKVKKSGFRKDLSFSSEREFRVLIENKDHFKSGQFLDSKDPHILEISHQLENFSGYYLYLSHQEIHNLDLKIVTHPRMESWMIESLNILLEEIDYPVKEVTKSELLF